MKVKKIYIPASIVAIIVLCAFGIISISNKKTNNTSTSENSNQNVSNENKNVDVTYLSASWAYNYGDINEISNDSDLIAIIHVNKLINTTMANDIPYSTYEVEVKNPIYGCEVGDTFPIFMTGGNTEGKLVEIMDDPLLEAGQEFLVFTQKNNDGTYKILSGPQGRLKYKDGKLNSLQFVNENVRKNNPYMNIEINNEDANTIIKEVKDDIKNKKQNQETK